VVIIAKLRKRVNINRELSMPQAFIDVTNCTARQVVQFEYRVYVVREVRRLHTHQDVGMVILCQVSDFPVTWSIPEIRIEPKWLLELHRPDGTTQVR
jgi:hypothetical protein